MESIMFSLKKSLRLLQVRIMIKEYSKLIQQKRMHAEPAKF